MVMNPATSPMSGGGPSGVAKSSIIMTSSRISGSGVANGAANGVGTSGISKIAGSPTGAGAGVIAVMSARSAGSSVTGSIRSAGGPVTGSTGSVGGPITGSARSAGGVGTKVNIPGLNVKTFGVNSLGVNVQSSEMN